MRTLLVTFRRGGHWKRAQHLLSQVCHTHFADVQVDKG
jgi:hypothetical protein